MAGHLEFALKSEGIDLAVLARLFAEVEREEVAALVRATPTGAYARRIWFLYEWLTGGELDVADPGKVRAVPLPAARVESQLDNLTSSGAFAW